MKETTKETMPRKRWVYNILEEHEGVKAYVLVKDEAVEGEYEYPRMRQMPSFTADNGQRIPSYWRHGMLLRSAIFNRNFFNLSPDDFGRKITATVVIKKKVNVEDSKEFYIMTDITKTNAPAVADMKLCHEGTGVLVHDNYTRINIVPRKTAQKQALAA